MEIEIKNNQSLIERLNQYLYNTKDQEIQKKPDQFQNVQNLKSAKNLQIVKKRTKNKISAELKIICQNIIKTFLSLNDQKFLACLQKIHEWNFQTCMKQFIMNYYIYIKNDNRLRNYIVLHLSTIIENLKDLLQTNLVSNMKLFNFENGKDTYQLQLLKNQLKNKLNVMVGIKSAEFNEDAPISQKEKERLSTADRNDLRVEITNKLRKQNKVLQELL